MAEKEILLTPQGLQKLEDELDHLKVVKRKEIAARIKEALAFGDISENSEYDEAKNEQAHIEERIAKIENMLRNARLIDENEISLDVVSIGTKVKVKDLEYNDEIEYSIVGSAEADPYDAKISNESPVGRALLGKKIGDIVQVQVPDGFTEYEILEINR